MKIILHMMLASLKSYLVFCPHLSLEFDLISGMREVFKYMENDGRIKRHLVKTGKTEYKEEIKGKLENGLLVITFLFNFDRIIMLLKKLFKILKLITLINIIFRIK